jgi:hypothetical protein
MTFLVLTSGGLILVYLKIVIGNVSDLNVYLLKHCNLLMRRQC